MTPKRRARSGSSSTFTLPTRTLPSNCSAMDSTTGESILQGPHQEAQKSTIARGAASTAASNSEVLKCWIAIIHFSFIFLF